MGSCEGETERDRKRTGGRETRGMIERGKGQRRGKRERESRVCKGEIIKKVRKQKRRGVPDAKMAVLLAEAGAFN